MGLSLSWVWPIIREVGLSRFRHRDRVSISPSMPFPISMSEHRIQGWAMRLRPVMAIALGRGVVLTRPLPNKTPSVGMKQLKLKLKLLDNTYG